MEKVIQKINELKRDIQEEGQQKASLLEKVSNLEHELESATKIINQLKEQLKKEKKEEQMLQQKPQRNQATMTCLEYLQAQGIILSYQAKQRITSASDVDAAILAPWLTGLNIVTLKNLAAVKRYTILHRNRISTMGDYWGDDCNLAIDSGIERYYPEEMDYYGCNYNDFILVTFPNPKENCYYKKKVSHRYEM